MDACKQLAVIAFALVVALSAGQATQATSLWIPVEPLGGAVVQHPIVGEWVERTPAGAVSATFEADGSVEMWFPNVSQTSSGTSFIGAGHGTWDAVGELGVIYSVVQVMSYSNGRLHGTITTQGFLIVSEDGLSYQSDPMQTIVTHRDARNQVIAVDDPRITFGGMRGASDQAPSAIAIRVSPDSTRALPAPGPVAGTSENAPKHVIVRAGVAGPGPIISEIGASENAPKTVVVDAGREQPGNAQTPDDLNVEVEVARGGCPTCR